MSALFLTQRTSDNLPDALDHLAIDLVANKYTKLEKISEILLLSLGLSYMKIPLCYWNSLGLCRDYRLNHIFFRNNTFLFVMIESWNFQHLFEKKCETSQNFNSIRLPIENMEIRTVWMSWMSWNFFRFHKIPFQTDVESFSFLYCKQKSCITKKNYDLVSK
jgi:hypothetical protein